MSASMNRQQIEACIPHRPPMLMVDEVVERDERHIVAQRTFRPDEFFFQGHYPDFPLVPGVILCEACMQAGAILLSSVETNGIPVATRLNDVRFKKMVRPGDTVTIHVELIERVANAFFMKAKMSRGDETVVRFEFAVTAANPDN